MYISSNVLMWNGWMIKSIVTPEMYTDYSAMRWPCSEGFHIPTTQDVINLNTVFENTWLTRERTNAYPYLHMPEMGWLWYTTWSLDTVNERWYLTCEYRHTHIVYKWNAREKFSPSAWTNTSSWLYIRPFKDVSIKPEPNETWWTWLYINWSNRDSWIAHNPSLWIISVWDDNWNCVTISDKNLWATTVYNYWDSQSQSNCWWFFQWWNSYMFPYSWATKTSWNFVDVSWYLPSTYSDDTFRTGWPKRWDDNSSWADLRWWQTWAVQKHIITKWVVIYPPQEEQTWYQEVEYIESWSDWNEQFIRMMFPYDNWAIYTYEIDVSNVWSATWKLFTYMQSVSGQLLRIYREACSIDQDMIPARQGSFTPDTYSIDWRYLYEWWFVNNEVDFRFDLLSDANFRLYSFKAYKDWVLFRDMIPCYDRSNWEIWMYDTINDVFYTNQWTWSFIKWPDVV